MRSRVSNPTVVLAVAAAAACGGQPPPRSATPPPATNATPPAAAATSPTPAPSAGEVCVFVDDSSKVESCGSECYVHTHTFSTTINRRKLEWQGQLRVPGSRGWYKTNGQGCCPMTCEGLERGDQPPCKVKTVYGEQPITLPSQVAEEFRRANCPPCGDCAAMLKPNPDAERLFKRLYAGPADPTIPPTTAEQQAISRFVGSCVGAKLLNELASMPCPSHWEAPATCTMGSYLRFKVRFRDLAPGADVEAGSVTPGQPYPDPATSDPDLLKDFVYTVSLTRQGDVSADYGHAFPAPDDACFTYTFNQGSSEMSKTLYHELLHIWWMNKNQTDYKNSGHGPDLGKCDNYQPEFTEKLRDFYRAMDELEKCLKASPKP